MTTQNSLHALMAVMVLFNHVVAFQFTSPVISVSTRKGPNQPRFQVSAPKVSTALDSSIEAMTSAVNAIDSFYQTAPYTSAFLTCGIKASAADLLAQSRENKEANLEVPSTKEFQSLSITRVQDERPESIQVEFQRNFAFILYGGFYQGMAQQYIYNHLFPLWFGHGMDLATICCEVFFDLTVMSSLICLPIAYITKAKVFGQTFVEGIEKYIYDLKYKNLLVTYWTIWLPAQFCTFGVVPEHLRIAFVAFISFFWLTILSTISSAQSKPMSAENM